MYKRLSFRLTGTSTAFSDTGDAVTGELLGFEWYPLTPDTGADILLQRIPQVDITDTGQLSAAPYTIFSKQDCLGVQLAKFPAIRMCDPDGFDTGNVGAGQPVPFAGDRLRVKITPSQAAIDGWLWVWMRD